MLVLIIFRSNRCPFVKFPEEDIDFLVGASHCTRCCSWFWAELLGFMESASWCWIRLEKCLRKLCRSLFLILRSSVTSIVIICAYDGRRLIKSRRAHHIRWEKGRNGVFVAKSGPRRSDMVIFGFRLVRSRLRRQALVLNRLTVNSLTHDRFVSVASCWILITFLMVMNIGAWVLLHRIWFRPHRYSLESII